MSERVNRDEMDKWDRASYRSEGSRRRRTHPRTPTTNGSERVIVSHADSDISLPSLLDEMDKLDCASYSVDNGGRLRRRSSNCGSLASSLSSQDSSSSQDASQEIGSTVYRTRHEPLHRDPYLNDSLTSCIARIPRYSWHGGIDDVSPSSKGASSSRRLRGVFRRTIKLLLSEDENGMGSGTRLQKWHSRDPPSTSGGSTAIAESEGCHDKYFHQHRANQAVAFSPSTEVYEFSR